MASVCEYCWGDLLPASDKGSILDVQGGVEAKESTTGAKDEDGEKGKRATGECTLNHLLCMQVASSVLKTTTGECTLNNVLCKQVGLGDTESTLGDENKEGARHGSSSSSCSMHTARSHPKKSTKGAKSEDKEKEKGAKDPQAMGFGIPDMHISANLDF